jgi:hypothetical protein
MGAESVAHSHRCSDATDFAVTRYIAAADAESGGCFHDTCRSVQGLTSEGALSAAAQQAVH